MENNSAMDVKLAEEIKSLLNQYNNDASQVKKALNKRLIICRIIGYAFTAVTCGIMILIIVAVPWSCMSVESKCPPGTLDYFAFSILPVIVLFTISIAFIRSIIRTKKLMRALSSLDKSQHDKELLGGQNIVG